MSENPLRGEIEKAIDGGLKFLQSNQLESGEFKSYRSTDPAMRKDCEFDSSPFPTALICYCLGFFDSSPIAGEMIDKAIGFFLDEMERGAIWRYWTAQHPYHKNIPPDLDDIACVSSILERNRIEFPDNRQLILANRNRQGLFYTWIVPRFAAAAVPFNKSYWRVVLSEALKPVSLYYFWKLNESAPNDVDCVVNANVLFYLGESQATRPVIEYLIKIVEDEKEGCCDKWHLNKFTFYYTVSRNYFAGMSSLERIRDIAVKRILEAARSADGRIGENTLETALAVCALINWKGSDSSSSLPVVEKAVRFLLKAQERGGNWERLPFYYGGPKKYFGWGSEEITTAFCLEALARHLLNG